MTIPALAPLFVGDFEYYRNMLVIKGEDRRSGIPVRDLISPEGLAWLLAEYRRFQPGDDDRALLSLWSRYYFVKLTVPVAAANLVLGHELPVSLDRIEVILDENGLPEAFRLPDAGRPFATPPGGPYDRFRELLDHNFEPLIEAWSRQVKVSRRVLWNNAANYFEWLISTMSAGGVPDALLEDGRQLIALEKRPDGRPNPMASPVRYVERGESCEPHRQRRHCCIRYRLPDLPLCRNCPHLDRPPKGALLPDEA
ncbi:siderophore-iron reductase FhuF [Marinobacter zhanjiangensis]|uniref:Siderophore-iron reductase FhuF n=1 Tax=Marinobacter zhanjiangensis TaxID=578215 RepID=A0ABQ3B1B9_9GAMM|nr:siderophore-iron reductase FhuF [Marinobacter zhanjiangensis]GGY73884.1 siderophore-iron reductase FhuF [Marinobacter zhanjiangensis]